MDLTAGDVSGISQAVGARPPAPDDPRLDGMSPSLVFEPEDDEACARALALCHEEGLAVVPVGGRTRLGIGNLPARLDAYLDTRRLSGVEDHIPGDLTVAVRAGTTLAAIQERLAEARQFLPLDAPSPASATIGGILAAAEPGLRRRPGARPRDVLLGFEAVLADGTPVRAGGRVVKNVAGYELMKLLVGSFGTLAVLTRLFLRLRALPEESITLRCPFPRPAAAERAWRVLRDLPLAPEVAALLNPEAARGLGLEDDWTLLLRFEGLAEEARGASDDAAKACRAEALAAPPWDAVRDFPVEQADGGGLLLRGLAAPASTFALAEAWQDGGALVAFPDAGVVYSRTPAVDALADRQESAARNGAGVLLERVPSALKSDLDVFGELPEGFEIMQRIKSRLDPKGVLSPGRFVGRI